MSILAGISWIAALCFLIGFVMIIIEIYIPGFGIAGITGIILFIVGIVLSADSFLEALIMILIILSILGVMLILVINSASKGKFGRSFILTTALNKESGYIGVEDLVYFLNKEGKTVTKLRPSGTADFDGVKLDVVSDGEFIEAGVKVKVISVQGRRIVVRSIE
ncbi:NfeD family protein [Alkaliphilus serpentinus]|uniref:NfeD-like C-terminal domain-containing protein n=1 Tax=Alkaliphilus serpentinus TaxID=1482731 RepID=A0A833HLQ7_9FIRM|nr:NfeD family protein [Alkaliphilus serpentinus]KAB3526339.1 hypothetical protein F8153_13855 [Alkaliphilus serpentinus]